MKRALSVFSVLLIAFIISASTFTTRYYLTELDFISNQHVPQSQTHFKPYISADYDGQNNLIKKLNIDQRGAITRTEIYSYDSLGLLITKDIYEQEETLVKQVRFGMESKAFDYIEYVYGVDTVKDWTDRFSILDYNDLAQLTNHTFFDVNAFQYGNARFEYDSLGYLSKEEWIRQPSGKTMRWWDHFFDPVTQLNRIMEYDSNGVLVQDFRLNPDGTESIFWFTEPVDSVFVNNTNLAFKNENFLKRGKIVWYEVDKNGQHVDSVVFKLTKKFLEKGKFEINMGFDSVLTDGAKYDLVFRGHGKSGYDATERSVKGVTFDIFPPIMDLFAKPFINESKIEFDRSEPITAALLKWISIHDSTVLVTVEFDSSDLSKTNSGLFKPTKQPQLEDGMLYQLQIIGTDRAGNVSKPAQVDSVLFDSSPPIVELTSPLHSEFRNYTTTAFSTSEPLQSWNIAVKAMAGKPDLNAPYIFQTDSALFSADTITKELAEEFQLQDGTVYRFELSAVDRAGNASTISKVDSVTYDITPPLLTTIYPAAGSSINKNTVSYSINEPLRAGEFRWEQTEGTMDSSAPHIIPLIENEMLQGDHIQKLLTNQTEFADGSEYTIMFVGQDLAGNEGIAPPNVNILYDALPPKFTDIAPISNSANNHQHVSYRLSENVESGSITWTNVGGKKDNSAPHIVQFMNEEKEGGMHDSLLLTMKPSLVDGGIYMLEFKGIDRAGNTAETHVVKNVLYDFSAPVMTMTYPTSMSFLSNKNFIYHLSETLEHGEFVLEHKGGKIDLNSPHKIPLTTKEKIKGDHRNIKLLTMPEVVEGAIYKLSFIGSDLAKNYTAPISLPGIQYDFTPPELSLLDLSDSTDINKLFFSYQLSEMLTEGSITWERTGGVNDPKRLHRQRLMDSELDAGIHKNTRLMNTPNLVDGAVYSISIAGHDRAGNESNVHTIKDIRYDISAPVLKLTHPQPRSYVSSAALSYELSEKLMAGKITYTQTGGPTDDQAPHVIAMDIDLKKAGLHTNVFAVDGPSLVEGGVYTISISGNDRAGNKAVVASVPGIIYDAIPPLLTIQTPDSAMAVNHNRITFTSSEDLSSGTIFWKRTGGALDPQSPYLIDLIGSELNKGLHENYTLSRAPQLKDGVIYDISILAKDFAGNESAATVIAGVLYDITPPKLQIISPGDDHYTKGTELTFTHSEDLADGILSWDGKGKNNSILVNSWDLIDQILQKGEYNLNDYYEPDLEDGGNYTITYSGVDHAGNKAQPVQIKNYKIDRSPPVFSELKPEAGSYVNIDHVGYTLNENIISGSVILKVDKEEQIIALQEQELHAGKQPLHSLLSNPRWIDGAVYTIKFTGTDFAGNVADTAIINNIQYDISPPIIKIKNLASNDYINSSMLQISVNEKLLEGQLVWEPKTGSLVFEGLKDEHINKGEHELDYPLTLEEKNPYSIYIQGVDRAGNNGQSMIVENVIYDITKPQLDIDHPTAGSIVNNSLVSYTLDEDLAAGKMIWQDVSGSDEKTVHEITLKAGEITAGQHVDVILNKIPELIDGASYMLRLEGTDLAGNHNEATPITAYIFDASPPEFTQLKPESGSLINTVDLGFTLNEDLSSGRIIFKRKGGSADDKSPHVVNLSGSRLKKGERGGVLPKEMVQLKNGAVYDIDFIGEDFAGNISLETKIENIAYDDQPPVVFLKAPLNDAHTSSLALDYLIGEDMVSGQIKVKIANQDEIIIELAESQRLQGEYTQFIPDELAKLNDGILLDFELSGRDAAGNISAPHILQNVSFDTTHPRIEIISPLNDDFINYSTMSIHTNEDLAESFLTVTQTGGVLDRRSPQKIPLQKSEMKKGEYEHIQFANGPSLQSGSIYSFEFDGKDFAGNELRSAKISNVFFDNEPPVVSLSKPVDAEQIKTSEISYMLSDNLSKCQVIFEHISGTIDDQSPHIVELVESQLRQGPHLNIDLNLVNALADGARYKVSIQGWDKAGNVSEIATVSNVLFDVLPPILAIHEPANGSAFNEPIVSIEMSEKLAEGTLTFKQTGGNIDANSPHEILILPPFNDQGRHDAFSLANDISLNDGSEYSITFNARDPAGNISTPVSVGNILYDITPPVMETLAPQANSHLRELTVNYKVNESLVKGQINIMQTLGTSDANSPHILQLTGAQLEKGNHQIEVLQIASLVSGAEYAVQLFGQDKAGNSASAPEIGQLVYDVAPPEMTILSPNPQSRVNHTLFSFNSNEKLQVLTISWIDDNGIESSIELPKNYFTPDRYDQVVLKNPPALTSGKIYTIKMKGTDLAGNIAEATVAGIEFDDTPPVFKGVSPLSNAFINNTDIQFSFNEPLQSGKFIWRASGGKPDPFSPRSILLVGLELETVMEAPARLTNQSELIDGTIYELSIEGTDLAGNQNSTVLAENITYDISPPLAQIISPQNDEFLNHDDLEFNVNEDLQYGKITWKRLLGSADPQTHLIELTGDLLKTGNHTNSSFADLPLVSGAQYKIELSGVDLAGNATAVISERTFLYDITPPQLTIDFPEDSSIINKLFFAFIVSEPLQSGDFIFTNENGITSKKLLSESELRTLVMSEEKLTIPLNLQDGSTYSLKLSGKDFAGNIAESDILQGIHYDISKPVLEINLPTGGRIYAGSNVSYTLSENINSGSATWTREGGKPDPNSPHIIQFSSAEMMSGEHADMQLENQTKLNVSSIYSLTMQGIDAAGNESLPKTVRDIEHIRSLDGNWFFQGAIMTVVWSFESDPGSAGKTGKFSQGIQLGTKISNQEYGRYKIDFSSKPWTLRWIMDKSGSSRISIFEFQDENHIRVVTSDRKKPKDWTDGEVMLYEYR